MSLASLLPVLALVMAAPQSRSLLANGGFEREGGWLLGPAVSFTTEAPRSGRRCLKAEGDRGAAAEQAVWRVRGGDLVSVNGWLRTRDVDPAAGGFAFLALYEYDSGGRLVRFVDFAKVVGTTDWHEHNFTQTLSPDTEYVVVRAGIHNALGTAWFDDINLVPGSNPAPWVEPRETSGPRRGYAAAILHEPGMPVVGAPTPVTTFERVLKKEGIAVNRLTAADLARGALSPDRFDLFIVPTGASFPLEGRKSLLSFLMAGGDLFCSGGYAFDHLVVRDGGRWSSYEQYLARQMERARTALVPNGGFEEGTSGWLREGTGVAVDRDVVSSGTASGRVTHDGQALHGRWSYLLDVEPGRTYLIGAKAMCENVQGVHYAFLAVYQYDRDGRLVDFRDFAQIRGTRDWERYEASLFIRPEAARVLFHAGLYEAQGTLWIDDLTCAPVPREERINAHYGNPQDALHVTPMQLTLFSPDQPLDADHAVSEWPGWSPLRLAGPWKGFDATAQLRHSGRWQCLAEARDRYGRRAGALAALVTHHTGPFQGSRWALFGATNRDVFSGPAGEELLRRTVRLLTHGVAVSALTTDLALYKPGEKAQFQVRLHSPRGLARWTDEGRMPKPATAGRSPGAGASRRPTGLRVVVTLDRPDEPSKTLFRQERIVSPGAGLPLDLAFSWTVPGDAPDFLRLRVTVLSPSGDVVDLAETGFCVHSPRTIASGPRLVFRGNRFELTPRGRPTSRATLFGTDTYGNMFLSPTCNPLTWYRDLEGMRNHGLHMFENLQYPPQGWKYSEKEWRQLDALIQLSQRFGLPYMAGLLIGVDVAVDDATLEAQAEMCRSFARRYRDVPGLIYYLNGDFRLELKDIPDLRRLWNEFLEQRYGSDENLRRAWGSEAAEEPLGSLPLKPFTSGRPFSQRAHDLRLFQTTLVQRWVSRLSAAIREEDKEHPITSEYYQRPFAGIDLRLSIDGMDVANFGYFGPPDEDLAQLAATIRWNDMRAVGKSVNIGEFGVKTHDAWAVERHGSGYHIARTEPEQRRQLWWVVHAALAYDVTKIQNWCWSDDPDGVFPWGVAYNNPLRPKPVLRLWRNLRPLSDLMPHAYAPADAWFVFPDGWRLGAPEASSWRWIMNALECLLATNVRFDVWNEGDIARHTGALVPRLVVAPFASRMSAAAQERLLAMAHAGATIYVSEPPEAGPLADVARIADPAVRTDALPADWRVLSQGGGRLVVAPEAWERLPDRNVFGGDGAITGDPQANPYHLLLPLSGVHPAAVVEADRGLWKASVRTAEGRTLIAILPTSRFHGTAGVRVRHGAQTLEWQVGDGWPCMAVLDGAGRLLGATCNGRLLVDGRLIVSGKGPWIATTLTGAPIESSARVAVSSVFGGEVSLARSRPLARGWVAEYQGDALRSLTPVTVTGSGRNWTAKAPANELVVLEAAGGR